MVAQTLVTESRDTLTQEMVDVGRVLISRLREQIDVRAAFWLYLPEQTGWRLFIASPLVRTEGPRMVYKEVQLALRWVASHPQSGRWVIGLSDITVLADNDDLIALWSRAVPTKGELSGRRVARMIIDGHYFDDAYIYLT